MLNSDDNFFAPSVPLTNPQPRWARPAQRLSFILCSWSIAATTFVTVPAGQTNVSEVRIVPQVIACTHPTPELTPDVLAAYRDAAADDVGLANAGLDEYAALLAEEDGAASPTRS